MTNGFFRSKYIPVSQSDHSQRLAEHWVVHHLNPPLLNWESARPSCSPLHGLGLPPEHLIGNFKWQASCRNKCCVAREKSMLCFTSKIRRGSLQQSFWSRYSGSIVLCPARLCISSADTLVLAKLKITAPIMQSLIVPSGSFSLSAVAFSARSIYLNCCWDWLKWMFCK